MSEYKGITWGEHVFSFPIENINASQYMDDISWCSEEYVIYCTCISMMFYSTLTGHCYREIIIFVKQRPLFQVADGTFMEEPGSGAVAIIENKKVSVGTLDWVRR